MTIHLTAIVPTTACRVDAMTFGFECVDNIGSVIDETFRLYPEGAAFALTVDGQPVQWHRDPAGAVVIDGPLDEGRMST